MGAKLKFRWMIVAGVLGWAVISTFLPSVALSAGPATAPAEKTSAQDMPPQAQERGELVPLGEGGLTDAGYLRGAARKYWMKYCAERGRLSAVRAAAADVTRRLGGRVAGVYVTPQTTVKDFVADSDDPGVDMAVFLRGAREAAVRYHDEELIVEVQAAVALRTIYASLKSWARTHYTGEKAMLAKIEKLIIKAEGVVIEETGIGVPREEYLKDLPAEGRAAIHLAADAPIWATGTLWAVGSAADGGAAELDARRKLAKKTDRLVIAAGITVGEFFARGDDVKAAMSAFRQRAGVIEGSRKLTDDGAGEVAVEIDLAGLWNMILFYQGSYPIK